LENINLDRNSINLTCWKTCFNPIQALLAIKIPKTWIHLCNIISSKESRIKFVCLIMDLCVYYWIKFVRTNFNFPKENKWSKIGQINIPQTRAVGKQRGQHQCAPMCHKDKANLEHVEHLSQPSHRSILAHCHHVHISCKPFVHTCHLLLETLKLENKEHKIPRNGRRFTS
jgi:hypothetical protein